jgi:hypothetical protein
MGVKNHTISFTSVQNPDSWDVEHNPMYEAFVKFNPPPMGFSFAENELRFNEFQRGWIAAATFFGIPQT